MRLRSTRLTAIADAVRNKFYGAALNLRFDNTSVLDPRITFSRTSNATLTNSAGVLTYAPHNLLTFSEQFDNAAWLKSNATVTANAIAAPNGTATADLFVGTGVSANYLYTAYAATAGVVYYLSCYVKDNNLTSTKQVWLRDFTEPGLARFNLSSGTVDSVTGIASDAKITDVGNGWYRISAKFSPTVSGNHNVSPVHIGQVASTASFYVWGAQLNVGALQPYYTTTVNNLLGYTQEFDNAAWTKGDATVSTNTTVAPDGSVTADTITFGTNSTVPSQTVVITGGTPYTISFYVHASSTAPFVRIRASTAAGSVSAFYNVAAGVFGAMNAGFTPGLVVNEGNGWRRVSVQYVPLAPDGGARSMSVSATVADNSSTAATGSTLVLWGAQLSDSASLDPYVYNPVAAPASTAYYGPRFDYDPVTLAPKGLLIEEQRTNLLLRSAEFDDPIWVFGTNCTYTANAVLSPDGTQNADTYTIGSTINGTYQTVAVSASTAYTFTFYVRLGTLAAANFLIAVYNNTAASFIAADVVPSQTPTAAGWTRIMYSFTTPVGCTSVRVYPFRNAAISSGTFSVWGAQLEAGAFPTSYIPTTTAAATRAADVATMIGANFSNWYNQTTGSAYIEGATYSTSATACGISIDDTTNNNRIQLRRSFSGPSSGLRMVSSGGSIDALLVSGTLLGVNRIAVGATASDQAAASNGALFTGITSITPMPTVTQMQIGNGPGSTIWNGTIKRIAFYPRRLANSELQSITA